MAKTILRSKDEVISLTRKYCPEKASFIREERDWLWLSVNRSTDNEHILLDIGWKKAAKPHRVLGSDGSSSWCHWYHVCEHPVTRKGRKWSTPMSKRELIDLLNNVVIIGTHVSYVEVKNIKTGECFSGKLDTSLGALVTHIEQHVSPTDAVDPAELL